MRPWLVTVLVCAMSVGCRSGCRWHESTKNTQTIGPLGGTIRLDAASLEVPVGGVKDAVTITVRSHSAPDWPGVHFVSPVFAYEPEGFRFERPAILTISLSGYEPSPGTRVAIAALGPAQTLELLDSWTIPGGVVAEIPHFSDVAAVEERYFGCDPPCDLAAGMTCLDAKCVKFGTNDHCSDKGEACGNLTCCPKYPGALNFSCKDIANDNDNCGGCGVPCYPGKQCHMGYCMDIAHKSCSENNACTAPDICCRDFTKDTPTFRCLDIRSDDKNCGGCDVNCAQSSTAGPFSHCCDGICIDFETDDRHCGGCRRPCDGEKKCVAGSCECPAGKTDCSGTCVDLQKDFHHCGTCGNRCGSEHSCVAGNCECPAGKTDCSGICVDLQNDSQNCATCGRACTGGMTCVARNCECPSPGESWCQGGCRNMKTDVDNCGICGRKCAAGAKCENGQCVPKKPCSGTYSVFTPGLACGKNCCIPGHPNQVPGYMAEHSCATGLWTGSGQATCFLSADPGPNTCSGDCPFPEK